MAHTWKTDDLAKAQPPLADPSSACRAVLFSEADVNVLRLTISWLQEILETLDSRPLIK